jgi:hypothetical protein|tara:strand:+ start:56119 stop:56706 length:588 start_codon:yes stop_codon:yes gene_type:complete
MDTSTEMAQFIMEMEGRRDENGCLEVYYLPEGDGGGDYEVAGINNKYHPKQALHLKTLVENGNCVASELYAINYIKDYTSVDPEWHYDDRVNAYLMDCRFNRGPTGAAYIFQHSLEVAGTYTGGLDGVVGSGTRAAAAKHTAEDLLLRLHLSRQWYERERVGRDESSDFWSGLTNRWVNAMQICLSVGDPYEDLV